MFREDFTPEANAINQALFEDKQGQLEAEVERLRCGSRACASRSSQTTYSMCMMHMVGCGAETVGSDALARALVGRPWLTMARHRVWL
jgi:hypothetical protein